MELSKKQVKSKYNRFSLIYDLIESPMEYFMFRKWRKKTLKKLKGKVLEIGVGTGKNLSHYNYNNVKLTAIDISPGMLNRAKEKAKKNNYPVVLNLSNVEKLPFQDNSFDHVVSTFVLCSVPEPVKAIKEMKRVVKKKGKIILLEHVKSKNKLVLFFQKIHNPITRFLLGFNIDRDTVNNIKRCGLKIRKEENLALKDVFKRLEVVK